MSVFQIPISAFQLDISLFQLQISAFQLKVLFLYFFFFLLQRKSQSVQEFRKTPHQHSQCFDLLLLL